MSKMAVLFALLVIAISVSSKNTSAQDCPSGHYYRMSGRCADAPARKPAAMNKKTPPQGGVMGRR